MATYKLAEGRREGVRFQMSGVRFQGPVLTWQRAERRRRTDDRWQRTEDNCGLRIWEGIEKMMEVGGKGQKRIARHLASPSLGHYASLSFVVIGEGPENFGLRIATQLIAAGKPLPQ